MNRKLQPALFGGLALGVASAIPIVNFLNCACCALVLGGGFLAAWLYLKDAPPTAQPPWGDGAVVGLLAGLIGAVASAVIQIPMTFLASSFGLLAGLEEVLAESDLPEPLRELFAVVGASGFAVGAFLVSLFLNLFIYGVFATLGALIGVAVFHKKAAPAAPSPPPPPAAS